MMKKRRIYLVLSILFFIGFLVCGGFALKGYLTKSSAEEKFVQMAKETNTKPKDTIKEEPPVKEVDVLKERGITIPEKNLDWTAFQKENKDIYAWITIPGTKVDYPVLQHPTDLSYYLDYNLDGSKGFPGCIYTQNLNTKDFLDPNTVIYGHNLKDGTMFTSLHRFEDQEFFNNNRYIYIYTPTITYVYEIFAAYVFSDAHLLYNFDFDTPSSFDLYLDSVMNVRDMKSHIKEGLDVTSKNHIITLSTCMNKQPKNRYLVQAVLINDPTLR